MQNHQIKEKLELALNKIGWKLAHRGGERYHVMNGKGEPTSYLYHDGHKYLSCFVGFGEDTTSGVIHLNLLNCNFNLIQNHTLAITPPKVNDQDSITILLYNAAQSKINAGKMADIIQKRMNQFNKNSNVG